MNFPFHEYRIQSIQRQIWIQYCFLNHSSSKSRAFQVLEELHSAETAKSLFEHYTQSNIIGVVKEQKKSKSEASQEVQRFSKWDDKDECLPKETVALKDKIGQQAIGTTRKKQILYSSSLCF